MKRTLSLIVSIILCISLIGCGDNSSDNLSSQDNFVDTPPVAVLPVPDVDSMPQNSTSSAASGTESREESTVSSQFSSTVSSSDLSSASSLVSSSATSSTDKTEILPETSVLPVVVDKMIISALDFSFDNGIVAKVTVINNNGFEITANSKMFYKAYGSKNNVLTSGFIKLSDLKNGESCTVVFNLPVGTKNVGFTVAEVEKKQTSSSSQNTSSDNNENKIKLEISTEKVGQKLIVSVSVAENYGISSYNLLLNYDKQAVTPKKFVAKDVSPISNLQQSGATLNGTVTAVFYAVGGYSGNGTMYQVEFDIEQNATKADFSITVGDLYSLDGKLITNAECGKATVNFN